MKHPIYLAMLMFPVFYSCQGKTSNVVNSDTTKIVDSTTQVSYHERAKQTFNLIQQYYSINNGSSLYLENFPKQSGDNLCSYLWSLDGLLAASTQLKALGYMDAALNQPLAALGKYYDDSRVPAAYASYPPQYSIADRYYDDNAIIALDLLNAYQVTQDQSYLQKAEDIVTFSLTGESKDCGGGLFWDEQYRTVSSSDNCEKAVCSSAFSTMYLLKLYQITRDTAYLNFAQRLYGWLNNYMQDPSDKLFWNGIRVRDQYIDKTKWVYNSGAMISNNVLLYEITQDNAYLSRAKAIAAAAYQAFTYTYKGIVFFPNHDSWFNLCLFRGYLDLNKHDAATQTYINTFITDVDYAWANARNTYGLFYEDWSGQLPGRDTWLLQQAAVAEAYAQIALLKGEKAQ